MAGGKGELGVCGFEAVLIDGRWDSMPMAMPTPTTMGRDGHWEIDSGS